MTRNFYIGINFLLMKMLLPSDYITVVAELLPGEYITLGELLRLLSGEYITIVG